MGLPGEHIAAAWAKRRQCRRLENEMVMKIESVMIKTFKINVKIEEIIGVGVARRVVFGFSFSATRRSEARQRLVLATDAKNVAGRHHSRDDEDGKNVFLVCTIGGLPGKV